MVFGALTSNANTIRCNGVVTLFSRSFYSLSTLFSRTFCIWSTLFRRSFVIYNILSDRFFINLYINTRRKQIFGGNVNLTIEPSYSPTVKCKICKHGLVLQRRVQLHFFGINICKVVLLS